MDISLLHVLNVLSFHMVFRSAMIAVHDVMHAIHKATSQSFALSNTIVLGMLCIKAERQRSKHLMKNVILAMYHLLHTLRPRNIYDEWSTSPPIETPPGNALQEFTSETGSHYGTAHPVANNCRRP